MIKRNIIGLYYIYGIGLYYFDGDKIYVQLTNLDTYLLRKHITQLNY